MAYKTNYSRYLKASIGVALTVGLLFCCFTKSYASIYMQTASWTTTGNTNGIAVDSSGNVYVTDFTSSLVRKYNSAGTQTASWTTTGEPFGIAVDSSGNVYVTDAAYTLVREYSPQ